MKALSVCVMVGALALSACMDASSGGGFVSRGGVHVNPVNADVFELGAPNNARVYVVGGTGPGTVTANPETAQFSLKPPQLAQGATGRSGRWGPRLGASKTVGLARQDCNIDQNSFWS